MSSAGDKARRAYMRAVVSVLARSQGISAIDTQTLATLCDVGIMYMQGLFTQAHSFGELATRTRPNLNDVGKALEFMHVSVSQLEWYLQRENSLCRGEDGHPTALATMRAKAREFNHRCSVHTVVDGVQAKMETGPEKDPLDLIKVMLEHRKVQREAAERKSSEAVLSSSESEFEHSDKEGDAIKHVRFMDALKGGTEDDQAAVRDEDDGGNNAVGEMAGQDATPPSDEATELAKESRSEGDSQAAHGSGGDLEGDGENRKNKRPKRNRQESRSGEQQLLHGSLGGGDAAADSIDSASEYNTIIVSKLPEHIPEHLPPFPSAHTFRRTPMFPTWHKDAYHMRRKKTEQSRQAEENLQRLVMMARQTTEKTAATTAIIRGGGGDKQGKGEGSTREVPEGAGTENAPEHPPQSTIDSLKIAFPPANFRRKFHTKLGDLKSQKQGIGSLNLSSPNEKSTPASATQSMSSS